jgi:hypothetical protein
MAEYSMPDGEALSLLRKGLVIPAHPLALTAERKLDAVRQQALTRYYATAGAGGLAVGVHTTQFEIRNPEVGLYEPVLKLAVETLQECEEALGRRMVRVAGICGRTKQALAEAKFAAGHGYDAGLLSLSAFGDSAVGDIIVHCREVARVIPLFGFYLQPAVGGRPLGYDFWSRFAGIENVVAIKIAPFNRYQTMDVVRAVAEAGRGDDIALYTGNDDNIVNDLLTPFPFRVNGEDVSLRIVGGLLGQWAVWTKRAVELLEEAHVVVESGTSPMELLARGVEITDANGAIFDAAHGFAGCIPGIHEVLRRQKLLDGCWCLNEDEELSGGQMGEIDRVCTAYPHLNDDSFVAQHLSSWMKGEL